MTSRYQAYFSGNKGDLSETCLVVSIEKIVKLYLANGTDVCVQSSRFGGKITSKIFPASGGRLYGLVFARTEYDGGCDVPAAVWDYVVFIADISDGQLGQLTYIYDAQSRISYAYRLIKSIIKMKISHENIGEFVEKYAEQLV